MIIVPAQGRERARILSWPRPYPENPYLSELANALSRAGVTTVSDRYLASLVARPGGAQWLQLHWPEWMLTDRVRWRSRVRARWLFALLDRARSHGVRIAWTAHNLIGHDDPHPDLAHAYRRALLRRCAVVCGHFAEAEADVRALGFAGRFAVTPHPGYGGAVPDAPARADARQAFALGDDERLLLVFGTIEPYKGVDRLADAFARARAPRWRMLIAGNAPTREALVAVASITQGDSRTRLLPRRVSAVHAATLFAAADALALGYRAFYTSGTAMLALTYGTPVIGPPRHHLAGWVGAPYFVPMDDPSTLGDALAAVEAMGPNVRVEAKRAADALTFDAMAETMVRVLWGGA